MTPATLGVLLAIAVGGGLALSLLGTALAIPLARRVGYVDRPGGHKSHQTPTPYGGGIAIFIAAWLPLTLLVLVAALVDPQKIGPWLGHSGAAYIGGLGLRRGAALLVLLGGFALHLLGIIDDVRPLGPLPKLAVMAVVAGLLASVGELRICVFLGAPGSIVVTVLWMLVIINAFNFLDNMDGLSAGVATLCLSFFVSSGVLAGQVFVPLLGAVFLGAVLGFLAFNFPPARIFMGDAGSLVIGYMLAIVSILTVYFPHPTEQPYALAMPLVILAVPLYDFCSVTLIRIREGRHPMRGDQRHFSHRLVDHGLSRRFAVLTIYVATAATGLAATLLPGADLRRTLTILMLVALVLTIIAILESPPRKPA